jgi:hypothetical protein
MAAEERVRYTANEEPRTTSKKPERLTPHLATGDKCQKIRTKALNYL